MAEMNRIEAYLSLERAMLQLDAAGDGFSDALREAMDPLWYELGDEDREFLNRRQIPASLSELEPLHGTLTATNSPRRVEKFEEHEPLTVPSGEWMMAT